MDLGNRIQKLRRGRGLSQETLAERLGVTRQAVSKWETGESLPDVVRLAQLADLFGVSTDYLIRGVPAEDAPAAPLAPAPQETPAASRSRTPRLAQRVVGWVLAGAGALGILTIWVLSTMIVSYRQVEVETDWNMIEVQDVPGYHFDTFVSQYHLQALLVVLAALLLAGVVVLLQRRYRLYQERKGEERA